MRQSHVHPYSRETAHSTLGRNSLLLHPHRRSDMSSSDRRPPYAPTRVEPAKNKSLSPPPFCIQGDRRPEINTYEETDIAYIDPYAPMAEERLTNLLAEKCTKTSYIEARKSDCKLIADYVPHQPPNPLLPDPSSFGVCFLKSGSEKTASDISRTPHLFGPASAKTLRVASDYVYCHKTSV